MKDQKEIPETVRPGPELAEVRMLCCDVDGVMTDGGLYYGPAGQEMLRFHVHDGKGLQKLMATGIVVCMISQSNNPIIQARAQALGVEHCLIGVDDKAGPVQALAARLGFQMSETAHIADDENDLSLLNLAGVPVTVPAGMPLVKAVARFQTRAMGGQGAVRELSEAILASRA